MHDVDATRIEILADELLEAEAFADYGPNGLQVEAAVPVRRLATAATASRAAIDAAASAEAQALLVHHGVLWGATGAIRGMLGARIRRLLGAGISLLAYHLPLDAHPEHGNNAWALRRLGTGPTTPFAPCKGRPIGLHAPLDTALAPDALATRLATLFDHAVLHCPGGPDRIDRVGVITGGGQGMLAMAAASGCDALITGETSEQTWHEAAELGIHCFACGHHATECHAIHAFGARVAERLGIEHRPLAEHNPL